MGLVRELVAHGGELRDSYASSLNCCNIVEQREERLTTRYCKQKWCITCNRIRMGYRVNTYGPVLREWGEVWFVTLTTPNVPADELDGHIDEMIHQLGLCRRAIRRTRKMEYKALRALEVTFSGEREDFHGHFHLMVPGKELAAAIIEEWLKRWPEAVRAAQDMRRWDGTDKGLLEATKYCTKLISGEGGKPAAPAWALDVIFRALHGRKLFLPIGFTPPKEDEDEDEAFEELEATLHAYNEPEQDRLWHWCGDDWYCEDTGEALVWAHGGEVEVDVHQPGEGRGQPLGP